MNFSKSSKSSDDLWQSLASAASKLTRCLVRITCEHLQLDQLVSINANGLFSTPSILLSLSNLSSRASCAIILPLLSLLSNSTLDLKKMVAMKRSSKTMSDLLKEAWKAKDTAARAKSFKANSPMNGERENEIYK